MKASAKQEKTQLYRLVRGNHGRTEGGDPEVKIYKSGDEIEMTELEAASPLMTDSYGSRIELIGPGKSRPRPVAAKAPKTPPPDRETPPERPHWKQAVKAIADSATISQVEALLKIEDTAGGRASVLKAGEERLKELTEK